MQAVRPQHWLDETSPADCIHGDLVGPGPWPIDVEWRGAWNQFIIRAVKISEDFRCCLLTGGYPTTHNEDMTTNTTLRTITTKQATTGPMNTTDTLYTLTHRTDPVYGLDGAGWPEGFNIITAITDCDFPVGELDEEGQPIDWAWAPVVAAAI